MDIDGATSLVVPAIATFLFGYLSGSIPFGLLIARLGGAGDVREIGSGNIGATNVLRTGRKDLAAATLLCDALKGYLPVTAMLLIWPTMALPCAVGAFIGHIFPVWLKFKGGKGVAVYFGTLIAVSWIGATIFAVAWLVSAAATRYSSLAALVATLVVPVVLFFNQSAPRGASVTFLIMSMLAWAMHRANIQNLFNGCERKIGAKE